MLTPTTTYITLMTWLAGLLTIAFAPGLLAVACAPVAAATVTVTLARAFQLDRDQVLRAVAYLTVRALIAAVVAAAGFALRGLTALETWLGRPDTTHTIYIHAA